MPLDKAHFTAKRLLEVYDNLVEKEKISEYLIPDLIATLQSDERTLAEFLHCEEHDFIRMAGLNLLMELRFHEIKHGGWATPRAPVPILMEALTELSTENITWAEEASVVKSFYETVSSAYEIPVTEPATLVQHFKNGTLDSIDEPWTRVHLLPKNVNLQIQHDIGLKDDAEIATYKAGMNKDPKMLAAMVSLTHVWKECSLPEPPPPTNAGVF